MTSSNPAAMTLPDSMAHLADDPRWIVWRYEIAEGRKTKIPYSITGRKAQSNNPRTWTTFERLKFDGFEGPGLMLGDGLQGVDLDACLDADGQLEPWADEVVERLDSYTEVSPSGRGVKVFCYGPPAQSCEVKFGDPVPMPDGTEKHRELAHFTGGRYFTVTGIVFRDVPIAHLDIECVTWLQQRIEAIKAGKKDGKAGAKKTATKAAPKAEQGGGAAPGALPTWLADLIRNGAPDGERSGQFFKVVKALSELGYDASEIEAMLGAHPRGIGDKYAGRLRDEIERALGKPDSRGATATAIEGAAGLPPAPMESDIWLAGLFAKRSVGCLRWSPGLDWMANLGTHWVRDETLTRYTKAKEVCAEISRAQNVANDTRRSIASAKTVNAVLTLARSDERIATPADAWDRDPMALNTPGGVYDLETGQRRNLGDDLFTQITAVAPDAAMPTPNWLRFISEIFVNDLEMVEFMQRLCGYCLTGDRREQKLPFFYGTGANGKSVLVDELLAVMGSYALNLPSEALMRQQHAAHPTELAQLRGVRLAVSSELEDGAYWAESRIKALTGDATLTARFMRQDFFEFKQTQKHVVVGNFKPRLKGDDPAIARRMVLVPFTEKFTGHRCDPLLSRKLAAERAGITAWMIEGARKWARDGLRIPEKARQASAEYLSANDDISLWLEDCCTTGAALRGATAALYRSFVGWKEAAGERPQSMTAWAARMGQRFRSYRTNSVRGFEGVALSDLSEPVFSYAKRAA